MHFGHQMLGCLGHSMLQLSGQVELIHLIQLMLTWWRLEQFLFALRVPVLPYTWSSHHVWHQKSYDTWSVGIQLVCLPCVSCTPWRLVAHSLSPSWLRPTTRCPHSPCLLECLPWLCWARGYHTCKSWANTSASSRWCDHVYVIRIWLTTWWLVPLIFCSPPLTPPVELGTVFIILHFVPLGASVLPFEIYLPALCRWDPTLLSAWRGHKCISLQYMCTICPNNYDLVKQYWMVALFINLVKEILSNEILCQCRRMAVLILDLIHYGIDNWIVRCYSDWSTLVFLQSILDSCVFRLISFSIQC